MHNKNKNQEFKKVMFSISILNSNEKPVEYFMIHNSLESMGIRINQRNGENIKGHKNSKVSTFCKGQKLRSNLF